MMNFDEFKEKLIKEVLYYLEGMIEIEESADSKDEVIITRENSGEHISLSIQDIYENYKKQYRLLVEDLKKKCKRVKKETYEKAEKCCFTFALGVTLVDKIAGPLFHEKDEREDGGQENADTEIKMENEDFTI